MAAVNPVGGAGESEGRDSWCTPKWLADLLGRFDLDPCSNPRSHIKAQRRLMLENGDDGLYPGLGPGGYQWGRYVDIVKPNCYVFINCPYARGQVLKWVKHWRHTRFTFLLRWDPSTEWFSELICHCTHVWFPARRINFEPPPGVKASSNPFPHALFLRDPDQEMLDALSSAGYLIPIDQDLLALYLDADERLTERDAGAGSAGEGSPRATDRGGAVAERDDTGVREGGVQPKLSAAGSGGNNTSGSAANKCGECSDCKNGFETCAFRPRPQPKERDLARFGLYNPPPWSKWPLD